MKVRTNEPAKILSAVRIGFLLWLTQGETHATTHRFKPIRASRGARAALGLDSPGATRGQGDLSGDGFVNISDFNIFAGDFGCSGG